MNLALIGVNHNISPIEVREKVSFTESMRIEASSMLLDKSINEIVILSTCNRSEIYIASENIENSTKEVKKFYSVFFNFPQIEKYLFIKKGKEVVDHLYMVASGLDSLVLGEDQILNQVKEAMIFSMDLGFSGKVLNKLFMEAIKEGKKIKTNLKISEIPLSTSYIGIKLLKKEIGCLEGKKALIIGAGEISKLALQYLCEEELDKIYVANRTNNKLKDMFNEFPYLIPIEYKDRYKVLNDVDIMITATSAPHVIITHEHIPIINKKLYILDLALPRDVDPKVKNIENIILYHIDDLKKISEHNQQKREELSEKAKVIIDEDVKEFIEWMESIKVDPVLKSLNERCLEIKEDTMKYINRKLDLNQREKKIIDKMLSSALKRVIREPIKNLKSIEKESVDSYIEMLNKLFNF
ncbi:glutamyl-tRNA reductase [Keratinibaculum paraultunense]|uniref:Glutamyl-tRNA reductase n=1 Tax=Keratinibaculum paraultunense TaxID=1278232 RepID=A0A4R3KUP8_9FIRM|nr:glutamyl-tRNA reductase [Keratinibaculum paraultunense]QQY79552.1 glutamyl-tRNA reductase [Keratinibaculum paraultunense]TCS87577.1 glutamyl-tRNA reductase [Keratinibaculum paraultunense]